MKKLLGLLLVALMCVMVLAAASAEVVSTTPIAVPCFWGHKVMAIAVEYDKPIDAQEFANDAFYAEDIAGTIYENEDGSYNYTLEARDIIRIYTNSEAAMLTEGAVEGNYVIVEFTEDFTTCGQYAAGNLPMTLKFPLPEGKEGSMRYTKPNEGTICQKVDITAKDGSVLPATETLGMTNDYLALGGVDKFELISIEREGYPEQPFHAYISLPEDYDTSKTYPIIFCLTGGSICEYSSKYHQNTDATLYNDKQVINWANTEDYGFEDVICVSLRLIKAGGYMPNIDTYDDAAAAAKYIIENYAVDKNRVWWYGQSMGSLSIWNILNRYPELGTGFVANNGNFNASIDTQNLTEEQAADYAAFMKVFADNKIKLYIMFGEHDNTTNYYAARYNYQLISDQYRAEGLGEREINQLVKYFVMPSEAYTVANNLTDHNVVRLVNWYPNWLMDIMETVFSW